MNDKNRHLESRVAELEARVKELEKEKEEREDNSHVQGGCETCIEYIKRMKRLEFDLQVEREERIAFEKEVNLLQSKLCEIEEEERDRVNMSLSYSEREYAYLRELEKVKSQNNMNMMII